jgi:hypothetical protein
MPTTVLLPEHLKGQFPIADEEGSVLVRKVEGENEVVLFLEGRGGTQGIVQMEIETLIDLFGDFDLDQALGSGCPSFGTFLKNSLQWKRLE